MDEFNKLIHNIDDMTEWDPLLFKNVTEQLNFIYQQDIKHQSVQWSLNKLDTSFSQWGLNDNYFEQISQNNTDQNSENSNEKLENILDKAETYLYALVNGFKKIGNKIR